KSICACTQITYWWACARGQPKISGLSDSEVRNSEYPMNMPLNTSADTTNLVEQARFNMIEQQIRPWRLLDEGVLELLAQVRREEFVPAAYRSMAFMDIEVPLNSSVEEAERTGQVMLPPRVEARMLQDAEVKTSDRVLEIGTGSGYMA